MRIFSFLLVVFCCFVALNSQDAEADLSLKENEKEYYDDSVFEELVEENIQEENQNQDSNDSQDEDDDNEDEDEKNIMKEWEEYMYDFVPADMLTYEIEKNDKEFFFEDITEVPSYVRGAYFVSSDDKGKIDFYVKDPKNHSVQTRLDRREGLFYFNATKKGVYSFIFSNEKGEGRKQITFAIHCGNSTEQMLKGEHLSPLQSRILLIENKINDLTLETKFSNKRQDSHYKSLRNTHQKILMFSLFETAAIFVAVFWQVYYIEKLLDNRRIV